MVYDHRILSKEIIWWVMLARSVNLQSYQRFRCKWCRCPFNERSGTVFNFLEYPADLVLMVVRWRLRYCLSLRNLSEMMIERGFEFTHEAVRSWEKRYAPLITHHLRRRRRGTLGKSWYVDETYIRSSATAIGQWIDWGLSNDTVVWKGLSLLSQPPDFVELMMILEVIISREDEERRSH